MSDPFNGLARTIVEEPEVTAKLDEQVAIYPRLQQLYDGLQWRLARRPESGVKVSRMSSHFVVKTVEWKELGLPALRLLYTYDDEKVTLLGIDFVQGETS